MKKRDLFAELMQGVDEMAAQREGKITRATLLLRTFRLLKWERKN